MILFWRKKESVAVKLKKQTTDAKAATARLEHAIDNLLRATTKDQINEDGDG